MSKKSLKYSHIKNCKGRAIVIPEPVIPEPVVQEPEPIVVRPKTKRAPAKPKVKPEPTVAEPITEKPKQLTTYYKHKVKQDNNRDK